MESMEYEMARNMTLLFFLERLLDKGEPRTVHDLSCQFGNKEFTKEMRQIAGGSQSGKFALTKPALSNYTSQQANPYSQDATEIKKKRPALLIELKTALFNHKTGSNKVKESALKMPWHSIHALIWNVASRAWEIGNVCGGKRQWTVDIGHWTVDTLVRLRYIHIQYIFVHLRVCVVRHSHSRWLCCSCCLRVVGVQVHMSLPFPFPFPIAVCRLPVAAGESVSQASSFSISRLISMPKTTKTCQGFIAFHCSRQAAIDNAPPLCFPQVVWIYGYGGVGLQLVYEKQAKILEILDLCTRVVLPLTSRHMENSGHAVYQNARLTNASD